MEIEKMNMKFGTIALAAFLITSCAAADHQHNFAEEEVNTKTIGIAEEAENAKILGSTLDTHEKKYSYIMGESFAASMKRKHVSLDYNAFKLAVDDFEAGQEMRLTERDKTEALNFVRDLSMKKIQENRQALFTKNQTEGKDFLAKNALKDGVVTTESGLQYRKISAGSGDLPVLDNQVKINILGRTIDGKEFQNTYTEGQPASLPVKGLISGLTEGLQIMQVGDVFEFVIPHNLAYDSSNHHNLGPYRTLIFEINLVEISE